jgi:dTDP-glucose pyrophosphorylase/mRNA-degrading endonuclease RelE of RelBE toxin-antitoxin system
MYNYKNHLVLSNLSLSEAMSKLEGLTYDKILFVIDENKRLLGSITDGDIRRGLLKNKTIKTRIDEVCESSPRFVFNHSIEIHQLLKFRKEGYKLIPILNKEKQIVDILNYNFHKSYLPIDVVIMAGGRGSRLSPLTDSTPKPLLKIGHKSIVKHNMDRLVDFGVKNFWISVNYLKEQIIDYFKTVDGLIKINFVEEHKPLGTIGAISKISNFKNDHVLVTNSDLLTNLNYEDFYLYFVQKNADIAMVTIPYESVVPYGVVELNDNNVLGITEKPSFTHYANAGIYLMKKEIFRKIPKDEFFNATDLIEACIEKKNKVISYPFLGYWLDIGKPEDFARAKVEINTLKF